MSNIHHLSSPNCTKYFAIFCSIYCESVINTGLSTYSKSNSHVSSYTIKITVIFYELPSKLFL